MGFKAAKGTLLFGLNISVAFSLTLNFPFVFVHIPRTSIKKNSGNFLFNPVLNFSVAVMVLVVTVFTCCRTNWLAGPKDRIRQCHLFRINSLCFFSTSTTVLLIFPTKEKMLPVNTPEKLTFLPDTPPATFLEINKLGSTSFFRVFSLIIVISDPVSNYNFIFILLIVIKGNFLFGCVSFDNLLIFSFHLSPLPNIFTLLTYFFFNFCSIFLYLQQVLLCSILPLW